jgi:hypothetical protein
MTLRRPHWLWTCSLLLLVSLTVTLGGCFSPTYQRRDPSGELFPSVRGTSLTEEPVRLPEDLAGEPALLLIGYLQRSQFDVDRWLLGLDQAQIKVKVREVPAIAAALPGFLETTIDSGMRRGIPSEDWFAVVTVYDDGDRVAEFTGNEVGMNCRVVLLDADGRVAFFHDRGYSVGSLRALEAALLSLSE